MTAPDRTLAATVIGDVVAGHRVPIDGVRIRVAGGVDGSGLVQVNLPVGDTPTRVQVSGPSVATAIGAAADRLDDQLSRMATGRHRPWPDPHRPPLAGSGWAPVTRLKVVRTDVCPVAHAVARLDAMDYEAHLYTDADTGEDAIVYRTGPTGLRISRQHSMRPPRVPARLDVTVNPYATPTASVAAAIARLVAGWLPFMFFTDRDSGRGNLLYRRYDGDLALITPPAVGS